MASSMSDRRKVVLCIDDDAAILEAFGRVLRKTAYEVVTAQDPWEGARLAYERRPDLILLDMMMPGLNGKELIGALCQALPDVPVVFITGRQESEAAYEAYQLGAAHYIRKPFENEYLRNVVDFLIGEISDERREELLARL